jgi:cytochrome oxidase assembly protein ShyY1
LKFKPSAGATLLLTALAITFLMLGRWQLQRAEEKTERELAFTQAPTRTRVEKDLPTFTRVELTGELDSQRHFLVDNRVHRGRPGVHVLTPFRTSSGLLLVNRGWLPLENRQRLPEVPTAAGTVVLRGHLEPYPELGVQLGEADRLSADRWPQLLTYPQREAFADALGADLSRWLLYLDADSPGGFEGRDWRPYTMGPDKHRAYALQWFALALTAVGAWVALGVHRARERDGQGPG